MTLRHQYYLESILTKDIYIFSLWTSELHNLQLSWANKLLREVYLSNPIYNLKSKLKKIELHEPYYFNQVSTSLRIYCPWLSAFCSSGVLSITPQAKPIPSSRALGLQSFRTIYIWAWPLCATLKEHHELPEISALTPPTAILLAYVHVRLLYYERWSELLYFALDYNIVS